MELRVALFYTEGQSLGGVNHDHEIILDSLREAGLEVEMFDLMNLSLGPGGTFLLHDVRTGNVAPWEVPHAALMYHGAIGPADTVELLQAIEDAGCVVVNGSEAWPVFTDKHLFADYMAKRDVRIIPSVLVRTERELRAAFAEAGAPVIVKKTVSTEGDDIFVVRTPEDLEHVIAWMPRLGVELIVQPIVDARIHDDVEPSVLAQLKMEELDRRHEFRVHTARFPDGSVSVDATYMRVAPDDTQIVNNVAQGARPIVIDFDELDPVDQRTVLDAAEAAPIHGDLIGWDLIGQPGRRRIIEGNSGAGLTTDIEGLDPRDLVRSYATVVQAAAESSFVMH